MCLEGESKPTPGCLTLCVVCGEVIVMGADLRLAQATIGDLLKLTSQQRKLLWRAQRAIRRHHDLMLRQVY
jgi:hypothetical protein